MAVTFNTANGVQGGLGANGLYAHIASINGPRKSQTIANGTNGHWYVTYEVIVHENASARNAERRPWANRVVMPQIDTKKWTAGNLDTYPTMAILYAHLKTDLGNISGISSIADAI